MATESTGKAFSHLARQHSNPCKRTSKTSKLCLQNRKKLEMKRANENSRLHCVPSVAIKDITYEKCFHKKFICTD
uniref:Uncharacterized protein n=1 Tax=Wuchereria bancrofti TaxID=6293 RepID=A0AAF5Q1B4_WUCBA